MTISIDIFDYNIFVYDDVSKFIKDYDLDESTDCKALGMVSGNGVFFNDTSATTIVHETVHLVDNILNEHLACDNTEVRAYLTEYIFKELYGNIQECRT